ncbi:unnamed protein product [Peniophora sp. CBMAI 1063]|nr:unnamed protein product [Peniophora sp. CBMAI 1063]
MSAPSTSESSSTLSICISRLDAAKEAYVKAHDAFQAIKGSLDRADDELFDQRAKEQDAQLLRSLGTICDVARFASQPGQLLSEDLSQLVERAAKVENSIMQLSYGEDPEGNSHMACGNVLKDKATASLGGSMGIGSAKSMLPFFMTIATGPVNEKDLKAKMLGYAATPHKDTPKPSLYTSPLARFGINPVIPGPDASPATVAFAEARCEVQSNEIARPSTLRLAGNALVVLGASGWKEQSGMVSIRDLSSGDDRDFFYKKRTYNLGSRGGNELVVDDSRKLVYNDGRKVINACSYGEQKKTKGEDAAMYQGEGPGAPTEKSANALGNASSDEDSDMDSDDDDMYLDGRDGREDLAFSLKSNGYEGVLGLADGGAKILRIGGKGLGIWDVPQRGKTAGFTSLDSQAFSDVDVMEEHPSIAQQRLMATFKGSYYVSSVDIETGRVAARYVGHNREVTTFASSKEDPHGFITASSDGGVRFYDSRLPAPIYAIEHSHAEDLQSVLYEHIGGYPFIIIGGFKTQQVKIWDARGRAPLYALSTGNNNVQGLAWDGERNQLFAATACSYRGRDGTAYDYRRANFGDRRSDKAWPQQAYHDEESFGYPFDCGSHRLLRYRLTSEPDARFLPVYGDAEPERGGGGGGFGGFGGMFGF